MYTCVYVGMCLLHRHWRYTVEKQPMECTRFRHICAVCHYSHHIYDHTWCPITPPTHTHTGDPSTKIMGDVSHGAFTGMIHTPEEQYHIEPASYHFPEGHPHHSIIYRSTDVDHTALKGDTCGLSHQETMERVMKAQGATRQKRATEMSTVCTCSVLPSVCTSTRIAHT